MLRSYINISVRVLLRHKFYATISILGLAVGMGVCLLIYQYIQFELSYDQFHTKAQHTYRLTQTTIRNGEDLGEGVYTTYALGPRGKETIPEVEEFVRVRPDDVGMIVINAENDERHQENAMWYVDRNFLHLFDFPLKYGDRESALEAMHSMVITEPIAAKYFGETDPVGKPLRVSGGVFSGDFVVTGVVEKLPVNSHLQFDFLLPMQFILENLTLYTERDNGWERPNFVTYVTLNEAANLHEVRGKLDQLIATHQGEELTQSNARRKIGLQPLTDVHLKSDFPKDLVNNHGDIQNVRFFAIIAIFILLMAWVNYINLSTARAMQRAKEVGVRKSVGAVRMQLIAQFIMESALINLVAALVAVGIAGLTLPVLNTIIEKELTFSVLRTPAFWGRFSLVILFGSLLSGLYPAFVLSSFKPVRALKSVSLRPKRGFSLRRSLIAFQFLISLLLISGTYLVYQQITYMKNQDLGFEMEKIVVVNGPRVILETQRPALESLFQTFKTELLRHHTISAVTGTSHIPGKGYIGSAMARKSGEPENTIKEGQAVFIDTDFVDTYDMQFVARRKIPEEFSNYEWLIINEEAVKTFGLGSPEEALNEHLLVSGDTLKILGVVKDVHWSSLRDAHVPVLFLLDKYYGAHFSIKMTMTNIQESIAHIESAYRSVYPDDPFHYSFLDNDFNRQYQADIQFGNLFSAFSVLAIFIACLGLFALVSYSATLRMKEMGIRKVLGAGVSHLMLLLSREYMLLLLAAIVVAIPAVIVGGRAWLDNYAYQTDLGAGLFLVPALILLLISLLTVSYRTYATARANPVESLRNE